MGDKYIIEKHEKDSIWRMYADAYGDVTIEGVDLTPYTEPDMEKVREEAFKNGYDAACKDIDIKSKINAAYRKGLEDAWEAARKIAVSVPLGGMSQLAIKRMFGVEWQYVLMNCTPATVIEKIRQHEQEQKREEEQIQVGDEVIRHYKSEYAEGDDAPSIFLSEEYRHFRCLAFNGRSLMIVEYPKNQYRKTGRHFPEIVEALRKMKENQ